MYEPVKFKQLKELVSELYDKFSKLHNGELSKEELESMTENSRELYERMVVLRFKAYQTEVSGNTQDTKTQPAEPPVDRAEETVQPLSFRIGDIDKSDSHGQVSLIDAIEEVAKESEAKQTETKVEDTTTVEEKIAKAAQPTLNDQMSRNVQENFYEKLTKSIEQKETLNHKLEKTPIPDLKKAIMVNQRFRFSKELFKGNNEEYERAIESLNTTSREEAMKQLDKLRTKYGWRDVAEIASDFQDLVERRYM